MSDTGTQINGLGHDTLPSLSTNVLAVQYSGSWYLGGSCKQAVAKSDKVMGRKKLSINIRSKKFGKYV
jgi:hypothetical protein